MVRFTASGSEATFHALRLARAVTGRQGVIKFDGAYHGHHDYGMWSYNRFGADSSSPFPNTAGTASGIGAPSSSLR